MRGRFPLVMALCAAVLAVSAVASAGEPSKGHRHTHLCPKCQLDKAMRESGGQPIVIEGPSPAQLAAMPAGAGAGAPCAACEGQVVVMGQEAPGYASLSAPGRAMLGGGSTDPMPIGVVQQAGYNVASPVNRGMPGVMDPTHGMPRPTAGAMPYGPSSTIGMLDMKPSRKPRIIAHLFGFEGLNPARWGEGRAAQRAEAHAMIPVGNVPPPRVDGLPPSAVYGQR